jgi:hypothetical protein
MDANLFHEEKPYVWPKKQLAAAKKICASCPVRQECLNYAIENKLSLGVWGGMTYRERLIARKANGATVASRRRRENFPHGTEARYQREIREKRKGTGGDPCVECKAAHRRRMVESRGKS